MPGRKYDSLYDGEVTQRVDPDGLGRIKVRIAGIIEPETPGWVFPIGGIGGGTAQHGTWEPPSVGANVAVLFKLGDIDHPRYLAGPWGAPDGVSDAPTSASVDDDDGEPDKRHNAVTEDEAWRIERDSRSGSGRKHRYLIRHKDSDVAVLIDADADKVYLTRENASEASILGTSYRSDENSFLSSFLDSVETFAGAASSATTAAQIATAAGTLQLALALLQANTFITNDAKHVSTKLFVE